MQSIEIMLSDGFIGNKAILLALSFLSTGNLNAKLRQGVQPFTMKDVLPSTHEYIIPPLSEEEALAQKNRQLLGFMASSPKAPKGFVERVNNDFQNGRV
jgi:hypothetical protein